MFTLYMLYKCPGLVATSVVKTNKRIVTAKASMSLLQDERVEVENYR